jgi:hypothetical protein
VPFSTSIDRNPAEKTQEELSKFCLPF